MAARKLSSAAKVVPPRQSGRRDHARSAKANHQFIGARGSLREEAIDRESAYENCSAWGRGEDRESAGAPAVTGGEPTTERPPQSSVLEEVGNCDRAAFSSTPLRGVETTRSGYFNASMMRREQLNSLAIARGLFGGNSAAAEDGGSTGF